MKTDEILANAIQKINKKLFESEAYKIASRSIDDFFFTEQLDKTDTEKVKAAFFEMQFKLVELKYQLGRIDTYIKVCKENEEPAK